MKAKFNGFLQAAHDGKTFLQHFTLQSVQTCRIQKIIRFLALGQGVALMSNVITSEYLSNGRLVKPFDESLSTLADFSYYLVCLEEIADRPDVTAFRDWLLDEAGRA